MRLQLIMSLAADVLHKSNPPHPACFHGDGASNCGTPARSAATPAKVAVPGSHQSFLWVSAGLWDKTSRWEGEPQGRGSLVYSSPPCDGRMRGKRRSSSEIPSPEMLNKRAGVSLPREWAVIGCRRPPVPMGARRAPCTQAELRAQPGSRAARRAKVRDRGTTPFPWLRQARVPAESLSTEHLPLPVRTVPPAKGSIKSFARCRVGGEFVIGNDGATRSL